LLKYLTILKKRRYEVKAKIVVTVALFTLLAVMSGYGQQRSIIAKIDFSFTVNGKVLPAGQYEFARDALGDVFRVQGEGKDFVAAPIWTRLAGEMHTTPQDAHLVFDVVDGTYLLSEIWFPSGEDGYLMLVTKGKHEHKVINVKS
jgi:hypothetical protein